MVMVVEEPAVEPGLPQRCLDRIELHISADFMPGDFMADAGCAALRQTLD